MLKVKAHMRKGRPVKDYTRKRARTGEYNIIGVDRGIRENFGVSVIFLTDKELKKATDRVKKYIRT